MSEAVLVSIRSAFLNAPGLWESTLKPRQGNWCKIIEGIDKTRTDGYSIEGSFVSQIDLVTYQQPGLYLFCEKKGRKQGNQVQLYALFALEPNAEVKVFRELKTTTKDWAVQLWPDIEAYMQIQETSAEIRRQELLRIIQSLEFELSQRRAELGILEMQIDEEY